MNRTFERALVRFAVLGVLVAALGLAGCGRKAGLDPPPSAAAVPAAEPVEPALAPALAPALTPGMPTRQATSVDALGVDRAGRPVAAATSQRKSFFLDWLLN